MSPKEQGVVYAWHLEKWC